MDVQVLAVCGQEKSHEACIQKKNKAGNKQGQKKGQKEPV